MNHIYLASQYARKEELRGYREELQNLGVQVTSSWLDEKYCPSTTLSEIPKETNEELAKTDLKDIIESDAMVFFAEPQDKQPPRGGRHFETGFAFAHGLSIFVIGEKENIFHYLTNHMKIYPTWKDFLDGEFA